MFRKLYDLYELGLAQLVVSESYVTWTRERVCIGYALFMYPIQARTVKFLVYFKEFKLCILYSYQTFQHEYVKDK